MFNFSLKTGDSGIDCAQRHNRLGSRCAGKRQAFSLIEVIAGIALAGTLLATALLSAGRHFRQLQLAQEKRAAVESMEMIISHWSLSTFHLSQLESLQAEVHSAGWLAAECDLVINLENLRSSEAWVKARLEIWSRRTGVRLTSVEILVSGAR